MQRVLVTGAATWVGGRLVRQLERQPATTVLAVDDRPPRIEFETRFVTERLDRLSFADLVLDFSPHRVVHLQALERPAAGDADPHTGVVVGTQALIGAAGRCADTTTVVVKSDGAVYGAGPRHPSVLGEDFDPPEPRSRYQRDLMEVERMALDMARTRPGVCCTVLRFAPIFGAEVDNPTSRLLSLPVVPSLVGFDPRLQFIHESDAVAALEHALTTRRTGVFNVAARGQMYLSRAVRLGRRPLQPLPGRAYRATLRSLGRSGAPISEDVANMFRYGRVVDTERMDLELGFRPRLNCRQTVLAAYGRTPVGSVPPAGGARG